MGCVSCGHRRRRRRAQPRFPHARRGGNSRPQQRGRRRRQRRARHALRLRGWHAQGSAARRRARATPWLLVSTDARVHTRVVPALARRDTSWLQQRSRRTSEEYSEESDSADARPTRRRADTPRRRVAPTADGGHRAVGRCEPELPVPSKRLRRVYPRISVQCSCPPAARGRVALFRERRRQHATACEPEPGATTTVDSRSPVALRLRPSPESVEAPTPTRGQGGCPRSCNSRRRASPRSVGAQVEVPRVRGGGADDGAHLVVARVRLRGAVGRGGDGGAVVPVHLHVRAQGRHHARGREDLAAARDQGALPAQRLRLGRPRHGDRREGEEALGRQGRRQRQRQDQRRRRRRRRAQEPAA
mmetsp:Transcript_27620/g.85599  ORF Transcript_27620/g.85599 Transcript_27620/m.85599 type:complete len:360 (-) Transcript_27620:244-1323(-)